MNLLKELKGCKTIGITGHTKPDGDCVGAVMSMYLYLKKTMPLATIVPMIETPGTEFGVISCIDEINTDFSTDIDKFDAFIGLDCSTQDRYGDALGYFENAQKTIVVDHHVSNDGFGDVSYIDPKASSTSELVFDLIEEKYLDIEIAKALYIGIIHDTGVLQYSCTSPKTLRIVARLLEFGFDFSKIIDETFYEKTRLQNEMLGRALVESIMFADGRCIVSKIDKKIMEFYGATPHDFEGIVSQLRYTKGVEVAIFMYELEPLEYKVSLRSRGLVDVSKIAKFYNGGGHQRAAGCTVHGTFHDCVNNISDSIMIQLERKNIELG